MGLQNHQNVISFCSQGRQGAIRIKLRMNQDQPAFAFRRVRRKPVALIKQQYLPALLHQRCSQVAGKARNAPSLATDHGYPAPGACSHEASQAIRLVGDSLLHHAVSTPRCGRIRRGSHNLCIDFEGIKQYKKFVQPLH